MPETRKILGQLAATINTEADLYEVPSDTQCVVSSILVCKTSGGAPASYRISITQGAGLASPPTATIAKDYLFYNESVTANVTQHHTLGLTLGEGDTVRVYSDTANVTFSIFGVELT